MLPSVELSCDMAVSFFCWVLDGALCHREMMKTLVINRMFFFFLRWVDSI